MVGTRMSFLHENYSVYGVLKECSMMQLEIAGYTDEDFLLFSH